LSLNRGRKKGKKGPYTQKKPKVVRKPRKMTPRGIKGHSGPVEAVGKKKTVEKRPC